MAYAVCSGNISIDGSGQWWTCDSGFVEQTEAEVIQALKDSGAIQTTIDPAQIDTLLDAMTGWFTFDPSLYSEITGGMLLLFVISWGAGIAIKTLSRI